MIRGKRENMREGEERESLFDKIDITKYSVKSLVAIPLIILFFAFAMIAYTQLSVGSPVLLGMDFQGGTMVRVGTDETREELTAKFADYPLALVGGTGVGNEKRIEFGPMSKSQRDELIDLLNADYGVGSYQMANISPVFGKQYLTQGLYALMIAFFLMAIVVFAVFRTVIPPSAVIFAAFSDIVVAVACMNLMGMELSLGTVAALLMLIGYSVDSNILLTTNLLRKKGDLNEKLRNTMKTGIMMTSTTLTAIFALFIVSYFIDITILKAISIVLIFGLVMDLMNTWLLNAGILRWYIEKQEKKKFVRRGTKRDVTKRKATKKVKA
ncbi:Protein-export membrane protein SecF [ANME-1 cluster archaeon GoMg2]|nr:Protein-export membrane protein SecF [ANME-1 cluster archaeon GoMg2]